MEPKKCIVKMIWSEESNTWYTDSDDIQCMHTGAATFEELVERVRLIAPEMLELNHNYTGPIEIHYETLRKEILSVAS